MADAWIEQTTEFKTADHQSAPPIEHSTSIHPTEDSDDDDDETTPTLQIQQLSSQAEENSLRTSSFFLTERQVRS